MKTTNGIYLDYAASSPLLPEVSAHISALVNEQIFNPSSIHNKGRSAAATLDQARQQIALTLGCKPAEIIFTSGGTEANNLAISGLANSLKANGKHIISCETEHPSVLESCKYLESEGYTLSYLKTDSTGRINLDDLRKSITNETILISLMWVNNETGLIHPVEDIAHIAREHGITFHSDAAQAFGHVSVRTDQTPVDALSLSGHKLGAPAGTGVLYLRKGTSLQKQAQGGSQEGNLRAGTQNMLGASSFAVAAQYHEKHFDKHNEHIRDLNHHLQKQLLTIPGVQINRGHDEYSPHILSCSFHDVDGEALFIRLDLKNIAVSNGAACSSGSQAPSHVLSAMGLADTLAQASLRISMSVETTLAEIDLFCDELKQIIISLR